MSRFLVTLLALFLICGAGLSSRADDAADAKAIVDKAVKALGGEEALAKAKTATWKAKTKTTFNGNDNEGTSSATMDGLEHFRQEIESNFGGNAFHFTQVLDGDKAIRKINDNRTDLDKNGVTNQKRLAYLTIIPITMLPLRNKDFTITTVAEEKVGDKPAVGIKVTGPEKKDFRLYFDKESGLPVRLVATVPGFQGNEVTQEMTYSDYKEMGGIKKATRVVTKRDGNAFQEQTVTEFKVLEKADPKVFSDVE